MRGEALSCLLLGRPLSASFILGDSYEGVRCPPGWSSEGLFGSARRGHMAGLTNALSWFDVDVMAGWVAPSVRVAMTLSAVPVRSPQNPDPTS